MTTLGRPESFRTAYQAALHDLAQVTAERDTARDQLAEAVKVLDYWQSNGTSPLHQADVPTDRESLGKLVRETWVDFCRKTQLNPKPSHIAGWDDISPWDKEVDCEIGGAIRQRMIDAGVYWSGAAYATAKRMTAERETAIARADAAEAEVARLRPMLDYAASKMELNAECVAAFRAGADAEKDGSHIIESLDSSAKNVRAALAQKEASHD